MFKHANQLFPGDRVRKHGTDKTASHAGGKVISADPENDTVEVLWDDGSTSWTPHPELEKE
jgi:hypothetical protein